MTIPSVTRYASVYRSKLSSIKEKEVIPLRVAVLGSRKPGPEMEELILRSLPANTTELVTCAPLCGVSGRVAKRLGLYLTSFTPGDSHIPGKAHDICLEELLDYCDFVTLFWDGRSAPARGLILRCLSSGKPLRYTRYH